MHHDLLRIAAEGMTGCVGGEAVVGAGHAVAIVLQPLVAFGAVLAAVDDAADAHQIARPVSGDMGTDRGHAADDLVPRHAGINVPAHSLRV